MNDEFEKFADAPAPVLTFGTPLPEEKQMPAAEEPKKVEPLGRVGS